MKLDTSSYYPPSPLDDVEEETLETVKEETEPDRSYPPTSMEKFADGIATFLSWVLVPLLMPVYGVILAFNLSILDFTPMSVKTSFTLVTVAFTVAVPALLVILLRRIGLVRDIGLNSRRERLIPYIISLLSMASTGVFMWHKGAPMWLVMFFCGGAVAALVNMLVNFRWKISAHAAGIAGVVAMLIRISRDGFPQEATFVWLLISIGLAGLLGASRIWLGRHTVWQVIAGYAVGFVSVLLMTLIH